MCVGVRSSSKGSKSSLESLGMFKSKGEAGISKQISAENDQHAPAIPPIRASFATPTV